MNIFSLHSTKTIINNNFKDATLIINDGKIIDIIEGIYKTDNFFDAENNIVMAGIVDPHVHINEPGRTEWEGFETATTAAIAGGVTTLVDMPLNASPVTTTVKAYEKKLQSTQNKLHCNVGFWGGLIPGNTNEIEPLIKKGVLGFKAFLTHSGIDEFPNVTEEDLRKAMPIIAAHNLPLLVHCELSEENSFIGEPTSYKDYLASRPKEWEDKAIAMMIRLCEEFNCKTHIVHLSSANSIEQIKQAKQKGLPLTVETAQHYLYFNAEDINDGKTAFKCAPPIREKENNEQLWQALKDGVIDFVATDHSPATPNMKEFESGNLKKAWGGVASIQFALPVLWTAAKKHNCTEIDIAKWLCENPAKFILPNIKKGKLEIGFDADIVVWNADETFVVTENMIEHKHKITPYLNEKLYGVVKQVYLTGEKVFDEGKFVENRGKLLFAK
jgi:allantoinase